MSEHLSTSELDALFEAAKTAKQEHPLQVIRYEHGGGRVYSAFEGDTDRTLIADLYDEASREFYFRASPATVERLVLMVRELEQDLANEKRLRAELKQIAQIGITEVSSVGTVLKENAVHDAVERFRARAVRAIAKRASNLQTESSNPSFFDGYRQKMREQAEAVAECADLIESLPLVETEGE